MEITLKQFLEQQKSNSENNSNIANNKNDFLLSIFKWLNGFDTMKALNEMKAFVANNNNFDDLACDIAVAVNEQVQECKYNGEYIFNLVDIDYKNELIKISLYKSKKEIEAMSEEEENEDYALQGKHISLTMKEFIEELK